MSSDIQELKRLAEAATVWYSGNWRTIEGAGKLVDENYAPIADIRGWGYLTGKGDGALKLPEEDAVQVQSNMLAYIAAASPSTILALIEENERLREALGEIIKLDDPYANWSEEMANIARAALTAHKEKSDG